MNFVVVVNNVISLAFICSYYTQHEVKDFEGNECEWPIFYTFLIIDGVFKNCNEQIEEYQEELRKCMYADANGGECHRYLRAYITEALISSL